MRAPFFGTLIFSSVYIYFIALITATMSAESTAPSRLTSAGIFRVSMVTALAAFWFHRRWRRLSPGRRRGWRWWHWRVWCPAGRKWLSTNSKRSHWNWIEDAIAKDVILVLVPHRNTVHINVIISTGRHAPCPVKVQSNNNCRSFFITLFHLFFIRTFQNSRHVSRQKDM